MQRTPRLLVLAALSSVAPLFATITVNLSPSLASPQRLGTAVTFTATASDTNGGKFDFQYSVSRTGQALQIIEDYDISNKLVFAPYLKEGTYTIQVVARNRTSQATGTTSMPFVYAARATTTPVAHFSANPLVALYSAPLCPVGSTMYVRFTSSSLSNFTTPQTCDGLTTMNWYIAGMLPATAYVFTYELVTGSTTVAGPPVNYTTGSLPANIPIPPISLIRPVDASTDTGQGVLLLDSTGTNGIFYPPIAVDLQGQVIWFYAALANANQASAFFIRPVPNSNGDMLLFINNPSDTIAQQGQIFREIDLSGNTVRQTSVSRINEQLAAMGKYPADDFDHDAVRLPNGHTLLIARQEEIFPAGTQGSTAPVDILGDAIIDLDQNLQIAWSWSGYDHLDINRAAVLGEKCGQGQTGCPPLLLAPVANDWLHANCLNYIPAGGDVLLSMRHQDWVAKIDYANGSGSGTVLWELGLDGNFTINSNDVYPWFSHQHDAEYELNTTNLLTVFDNGNTRVAELGPGNSRGMYLNVDETAFQVTPILVADLGVYSKALGSAQLLDNGNFHFDAGIINNTTGQSIEVLPDGTLNYTLQDISATYRSYRMDSLYKLDANSN